MGDHRAEVKIELALHGKTYRYESWINWTPDDDGVDYRVRDFFRDSWQDAIARYDEAMRQANERNRAAETEANERRELARLKEKYAE